MNYSQFKIEDFVSDEYFRQWVLKPDHKNKKFWTEWLERNPSKKNEIEQAKKIVSQFEFNTYRPSQEDVASVWDNITTAINEPTTPTKVVSIQPGGTKSSQWWNKKSLKIAASLVILFISIFLVYPGPDYFLYEKFTTQYSQVETLRLADNTEVTLGANSVLKKKRAWLSANPREVWLTGKAYFTVAKQQSVTGEKLNFVVHTDDLQVEVLGTQFSVNTRREKTRVVLTEGKVKLDLEGKEEVFMSPGDMVEFSSTEESLKIKKVDPAPYVSWKENKLIFDGSTLREIANQLEDQHGLKITFEDDALQEKKFRGAFEIDKIDVLLEAIGESFDIEVKKEGNEIRMKRK